MEAIGTAASVTALIQLAGTAIRVTTDIIRRFQDAPEEIHHLSRQLSLLHSELNFINHLKASTAGDDLALLPSEIEDLRTALYTATTLIFDVQRACNNYEGKSKVHARFCWVFHDQSKMQNVVSRLQEIRMSLHTILLLVNVRITNLSRKAIATASSLAITSNVSLLQDVAAIRKSVENIAQQGRPQENIVLNGLITRAPHDGISFWKSLVFLEKSWIRFLGIEAVLSIYGNDYQTTYDFSARQSFLGLRLLCLDLRLRRFPLAGLGLSFVAGGLTLKNVVPENSQIMTACKMGDVIAVRELFRAGHASPNDVTPENSNPLRYAIENGSKELIQTILTSGADVNSPFGQFMTSPLEWAFASRKIDIARLFIEKGAKVDHISAKGWTPAFNLFGYEWIHKTKGSCIEYLELLSAASFSEFDIQDVDGWSVMHRAAAFGSAEDITALVNVGSSATLGTNLDWLPIRCATRFENVATFLELVKYLHPSFIHQQDKRGWTLLHEAASMGSSKMLDLILRQGADPHVVSFKTSYMVPSGLENRLVTPGDVARHEGEDTYHIYVEALKSAGFGVSVIQDLEKGSPNDSDDDIFWPTESEAGYGMRYQ